MTGARSRVLSVAILSGPMGAAYLNGALGRGGYPRLAGHPFTSVRSAVRGTPGHASLATTSTQHPTGWEQVGAIGGYLLILQVTS